MRKITPQALRRIVWRMLTHKVSVIYLDSSLEKCSATMTEDDRGNYVITINPYYSRIDYAVVHELSEWYLRDFIDKHLHYHTYELLMEAMEREFFKHMTEKERKRWLRAIKKKVRLKTLKK